MKKREKTSESDEQARLRSSVLAICERLSEHCDRIKAMLNGFEVAQANNAAFSFNYSYKSTESSLTKAAMMIMLETYESLRHETMEIAQVGYVDFELLFPKLDINFETYYSVAVSLLNLIYQMQLMRLYCYRLLKS